MAEARPIVRCTTAELLGTFQRNVKAELFDVAYSKHSA